MKPKRRFSLLLVALFCVSIVPAPARSQPVLDATPQQLAGTAPDPLSSSGYVNDFTVADPVAYWHTAPAPCPQGVAAGGAAEQPAGEPAQVYTEVIGRTPTYGGDYRWLYHRYTQCGQSDLNSNLVADGEYIYWVSVAHGGLVRLSKNANYLDTPQFMAGYEISGRGYLAQHYNKLYFLNYDWRSLYSIDKSTFAKALVIQDACADCGKLIVTDDYYYVKGHFGLARYRTDTLERYIIESTVGDFVATNYNVWFTKGNAIYSHENVTGLEYEYPIYVSPVLSGQPFNLVLGNNHIFFFEIRNACGGQPFPCYDYLLIRKAWDGSGPAEELVFYNADPIKVWQDFGGLSIAGAFVFYRGNGTLYRLPQDAAALPKQNMWITDMEVTQGIQTVDNQVGLIAGRRTFVRVYARSEVSAVPGVTAYLYRTNAEGDVLQKLVPVNWVGQRLTVIPNPNRNDLNQSFLFELPTNVTVGTERLFAVLNPTRLPLEPNYADNRWPAAGTQMFNFRPSPRLETVMVSFGYTLTNRIWWPSVRNDILPIYSYIRRTYPLSSAPGDSTDPTPGFRPNRWRVLDAGLGTRVDQSDPSCASLGNLCASAYVNGLLQTMRTTEGVADAVFMYGMISDAAGFFPRGQEGGGGVSSGPVGNPALNPQFAWDTDTTYGDWYAAHEIGHSLGRAHPSPASDDPATPPPPPPGSPPPAPVVEGCGHSRSDNAYPYPNAELSPAGGAFAGFDVGDGKLRLPMRFIPGNTGHDVMSYCNDQWLSDYTYRAIYRRLMGNDLTPGLQAAAQPQAVDDARIPGTVFSSRPKIAGDFLSLAGVIVPNSSAASLQVVRRLSAVAGTPSRVPGEYSIRLLSAGGTVLASYPFTPEAVEDAGALLSFHQVVDFTPGAAAVEILRLADGAVLGSYPLSANPPTISGVTLVNPPNPVIGTVTLSWNAGDVDGDALSFDLSYSRDGGLTFIPLRMGVQGASAQVDTAELGGSNSAIFRVTASDGANLASADTPPFAMAAKPPVVRIINPEDGLHIQHGQIINLEAEADDLQDGSQVTYSWKTQNGVFGSGDRVTVGVLAIGANIITVTATNSQGQSASDSITVHVGDDLNLPGPTLSVGPSRLSFHVGAGSSTKQSAEISVANSGSGTLDWSASVDAAWLSLDTASGSAAAVLTVSVDPSGLEASRTYTANVTINSTAAGSPVTIPVTLSIGDMWTAPSVARRVFLPIVSR